MPPKSLIRPFAGLRPVPDHAADVAAPPYDVLNTAEARKRAEGSPWSFLHISRPEIDLPLDTDPYDAAVYAQGKASFDTMLNKGILEQDSATVYYFYRLVMNGHNQTGLVAVASVEAYDANRIRKHEFTHPDKEDDRVRQIDALNAQTGPVFLTYRHDAVIDAIVDEVTQADPVVDTTAYDGVQHTLWMVSDQAQIQTITDTFDVMACLYIADGHHRSAAASRVAQSRKAANPNHTGEESYNYFLTVIFPDNQMQILDYNRVVKDLNGLEAKQFIDTVAQAFTLASVDHPVKPVKPGEFGMYLVGQWYRIIIHPDRIPQDNPVKRLDVSLLADNLIAPILNITDLRRDKRIDFIGGIRGLKELEQRVDSGEMAVAFSLYPTAMGDLIAVADAEEVMPPKSTWFEPKLADGLVSHVLD